MKKKIVLPFIILLVLNAASALADKPEPEPMPAATVIINTEITAAPSITDLCNRETKLTEEETNILVNRVNEIRDMDKSALTKEEKRALKKELSLIKEKLKRDGTVVVFSSSFLIIFILLLIILL